MTRLLRPNNRQRIEGPSWLGLRPQTEARAWTKAPIPQPDSQDWRRPARELNQLLCAVSQVTVLHLWHSPLTNAHKQFQTNRKRVFPQRLAINHTCS